MWIAAIWILPFNCISDSNPTAQIAVDHVEYYHCISRSHCKSPDGKAASSFHSRAAIGAEAGHGQRSMGAARLEPLLTFCFTVGLCELAKSKR